MRQTLSWRSRQLMKTDRMSILLLVLLWLGMSVLVNPLGDFPLNDDWVYARAVRSIVEEGNFTLAGGNAAANLIAQAFWGALFCLPFGFSFSALRLSTLVLGLLGVLATYGLLREVGAGRLMAFGGALLIALNPIYFGLSNTFMTDVPFFAAATMALYFFIKGLKSDRPLELILGTVFSCLSLFIRQNGMIIPLAFGCAYLCKRKLVKANIVAAFAPTVLCFCLQLLYQNWLEWTHRTSPNFNLQSKGIIKIITSGNLGTILYLIDSTLIALVYIGLFLSPLLVPLFFKKIRASPQSEKRFVLFLMPTILILTVFRLSKNRPAIMPLKGNTLMDFGLGPLTLHDGDALINSHSLTPAIVTDLWAALTALGVLSAALLIYYSLLAIRQILKKPEKDESVHLARLQLFIVLTIVFYYLPFGISTYFDRYLLILIPLFLMLVINTSQKAQPNSAQPYVTQSYINQKLMPIALSLMLLYGGFTVGVTHDYLALNRIRWQALNTLTTEQKVSPNDIDGGYEFNGWYLYNPKDTYAINFIKDPARPDKSWWYVDKDDYMITFKPLAGYKELQLYQTERWLPFGPRTISVLRKEAV